MYSASAPGVGSQAGWPRLLGDIGGTNARLGWLSEPGASITGVRVWPCADFAGPVELMRAYLAQVGLPTPNSAVLGMANPVAGDAVQMTNLHWRFSVVAVRLELKLQRLLVLNDFTALALAIPSLPIEQLHPLGPACPTRNGPLGLIGAGTGLGVSGLLPVPGTTRWVPITGEGGHVTLTANDELEFAIIQCLRSRFGHVSAERVLSGGGLVNLYHALVQVQGLPVSEITTPAELLAQGLTLADSTQRQALDVFCGWLGSVAGDLALTLGAVGGIYIGGGIAPRMREHLSKSTFRQRFITKGRYLDYLQTIPTWLIDAPVSPALDGAALALEMLNAV
jgi:glucokinase